MVEGYNFGHKIYAIGRKDKDGNTFFDDWRYVDNDEKVNNSRNCPKCNLPPTTEGHDPCIKNLPNVEYACCGHGINDDISKPYVKLKTGKVHRFENLDELLNFFKNE